MNVTAVKKKKKKKNEYLGDGCEEEEKVVKGEWRSEKDERHDGEAKEY